MLLFIAPILLLYFQIIPLQYRFLVLTTIFFVVVFITFIEKWNLKQLGIRVDNLKEAVIPYLALTFVGGVGIIFLAAILGRHPMDNWWTKAHFQYLFIPISFTQEFVFRGFLIPRLKSVSASIPLVILVNSLLYAFPHIIYPLPALSLAMTFIAGIGWATIYYFYPNLLLVFISHMALNLIAVLFCFVGFGNCY
ncbi:MAG: Uncharacterized protein G01um10147_828 [Microgenomates group bacterium Gr01-1014_7]|nr:MAG: Uncharacterized protein G01um10147_828 [Microgenomates group bacterium Gr01-1014_7]